MKKVLAIVLSVAMLLSVLSVNVFAEDDVLFDLSQYKSEIADYETGKVAEGWCPSAITEWNGQQDTMAAFVEALRTEGAYIEVITKPNSDGGNVNGLLLMSYPLDDGDKYTSTIFSTKLADAYEIEDGKTVTTFDAAAAVAQYESTPHEDDDTGETMCSLDKLMNFGIDIPSGAIIYNVMVKTAPTKFAEYNGREYETVAKAIEAAVADTETADKVVTLTNDIEESVTIPAGVTLELNGNTLTGDVTVSAGAGLTVAEGDTLDGDVVLAVGDTTGAAYKAYAENTSVVITGGTITGSVTNLMEAYKADTAYADNGNTDEFGFYINGDDNALTPLVTVTGPGEYEFTYEGTAKGPISGGWLYIKGKGCPVNTNIATIVPEGTKMTATYLEVNGTEIELPADASRTVGNVFAYAFWMVPGFDNPLLANETTPTDPVTSLKATMIIDVDNYVPADDLKSVVSITGGKFTTADIEDYLDEGYVVDGGNVTPAPSARIIVTNGDNTPIECDTMEDALAHVQENGKITLLSSNVEVDKMVNLNKAGVTLDLGGNTLTASESFTYTDKTNLNDAHVVNISADNVKVCNGTIKSTVNNKHCLNVYQATGVVVEGLTLDHTNANAIKGGAPMVVGGSDVTVKYMLETITGANSWYGINVDTYAGLTSSLKFDANAQMIFSGTNPFGIYLESTRSAESGDTVNVTFGENVSITAPEGVDFNAVSVNRESTGANNITVTDPENAGLKDNGDGTFEVKPVGTSNKNKITGCVYLNEDYHALIVNGRFIAQPHVDNGTGFCVACKGAINK